MSGLLRVVCKYFLQAAFCFGCSFVFVMCFARAELSRFIKGIVQVVSLAVGRQNAVLVLCAVE